MHRHEGKHEAAYPQCPSCTEPVNRERPAQSNDMASAKTRIRLRASRRERRTVRNRKAERSTVRTSTVTLPDFPARSKPTHEIPHERKPRHESMQGETTHERPHCRH